MALHSTITNHEILDILLTSEKGLCMILFTARRQNLYSWKKRRLTDITFSNIFLINSSK